MFIKLKKSFLGSVIAALALFSCAKSESFNLSPENSNEETIPLSEALSELDAFLFDIGRVPTRSVSSSLYDKNGVFSFGAKNLAPATRSFAEEVNMPDSLFYLVNFQEEGGFAILSANRSLGNKVIAATETGGIDPNTFCEVFSLLLKNTKEEISISDTLFVPILLLSSSMLRLNGAIERFDKSIDDNDLNSYSDSVTRSSSSEDSTSGSTRVQVFTYGPFVKTKWDQRSPFNDLCDGAVGCCAIATGQIIVANRTSPSMIFDGVTCSWDKMESVRNYRTPDIKGDEDAQAQAAHFIKVIRSKDYCRISSGGSGDSKDAKRAFEKFGYKKVTRYWGMGENARDAIHQCLRQKHPVYVDGLNKGLFSGGHCWLVDGYIDRQTIVQTSNGGGNGRRGGGSSRSNTSRVHHDYYHHINWGWRGIYDGYYHIDDFQVSNRQSTDEVIDKDTASLTDSSVKDENYTWDIWIVTYSI